jgi:hypothetical protein
MPLLWNHDWQPLVVDQNLPAIQPGGSHNFSDEQVANGIGGLWSAEPPGAREKRAVDKAKKAIRGTPQAREKQAVDKAREAIKKTEPAEPEKEKEKV